MAAEPQQITLVCSFSPDRTTVRIALPGEQPMALEVDATGLDALMRGLAEIRAEMQPGVPAQWPAGQVAAGTRSPAFLCEAEALHGGCLLHLRHPGYGWLHFALPIEVARRIGTFFLRQAKTERVKPSRARRS